MVQLSWFVITILARAFLGMAITTLELSTLGFILCTLFTYFFWRHKPQDISCPIVIQPKVSLADILVQAGPVAARPYSQTPLDFAKRKAHLFEHVWRYSFNIPNYLGFHFHPMKRPITKIWDDQFYDLTLRASALLGFVQFGFSAIHFAAWNFHFPSNGERLMWRVSSIYIICSMMCTWFTIYSTFVAWPWMVRLLEEQQSTNPTLLSRVYWRWRSSMPCQLLRRISKTLCNNSTNGDPDESVPLFAVVTLIPLGVLYMCARMYIIIEDVINLRDLPPSTY